VRSPRYCDGGSSITIGLREGDPGLPVGADGSRGKSGTVQSMPSSVSGTGVGAGTGTGVGTDAGTDAAFCLAFGRFRFTLGLS